MYCVSCGYDLRGHEGFPRTCPECGWLNRRRDLQCDGNSFKAHDVASASLLVSASILLVLLGLFLVFWTWAGWIVFGIGGFFATAAAFSIRAKCRLAVSNPCDSKIVLEFICRTVLVLSYVSTTIAAPILLTAYINQFSSVVFAMAVFLFFLTVGFCARGFFAEWLRSYQKVISIFGS